MGGIGEDDEYEGKKMVSVFKEIDLFNCVLYCG